MPNFDPDEYADYSIRDSSEIFRNVSKFKSIKTLKIFNAQRFNATTAGLITIVKSLINLSELTLGYLCDFTADNLLNLIRNCRKLEQLTVIFFCGGEIHRSVYPRSEQI